MTPEPAAKKTAQFKKKKKTVDCCVGVNSICCGASTAGELIIKL